MEANVDNISNLTLRFSADDGKSIGAKICQH